MDGKIKDKLWGPDYYDGALKAFRKEFDAMEKAVRDIRGRYDQMVNMLYELKSESESYDNEMRDTMMKIARDTTGVLPPLTWRSWDSSKHISARQDKTADMSCDKGHSFTLMNHSISPEGSVSPSVVCPEISCRFHEYVILEGWEA
jgi:hypothetical protein